MFSQMCAFLPIGVPLPSIVDVSWICWLVFSRQRYCTLEQIDMVVSAIFILDSRGKVLISRNYRGDIPMYIAEKFITLLQQAEEEQSVTPVLQDGGYNYLYVRHSNIYLLAITRKNANAVSIFVFLHRLIQVFKDYFKELEEESIRDNFVIIYELLDEMMDFGYPQFTESKILREYIIQQGFKLECKQIKPPGALTNVVSWRSDGIKYRKNEVFLDVIESLNLSIGGNDTVISSEILGVVKMRCDLSGMPELKLGLNDKILFESSAQEGSSISGNSGIKGRVVEMEDIKFHQCVRLNQFERDRTILFIPPDGDFELMSYRLNATVKPLIWTECVVNIYSGTRVEILLKVKSQFKKRSIANNVEIHIPVADDVYAPQYKVS